MPLVHALGTVLHHESAARSRRLETLRGRDCELFGRRCLAPSSTRMQPSSGRTGADVPITAQVVQRQIRGELRREYLRSDNVPPSLSAGCLSDHWSGVISAAMLVCQDVSVVGCLWDNVLFE